MKTEAELRILADDLARQAREAGCMGVIVGVLGALTPAGAAVYCKWDAPSDHLVVTLAESMETLLGPTKEQVRRASQPEPSNRVRN